MIAEKNRILNPEDLDKLAKNIVQWLDENYCKEHKQECPESAIGNFQTLMELLFMRSDLNYLEIRGMLSEIGDNIRYSFSKGDEDEDEEEIEE